MPTQNTDKLTHCPALTAIRAISGKWKTRILWVLRDGPMQFGDLRRTLPGVSAKVLTDQLRELEKDSLITRHERQEAGVTLTDYSYSTHGQTLIPVLDALGQWGLRHAAQQA